MIRTRECIKCHHKWDSDVVYTPHNQMLTGEVTPPCPQCDDRAIMSGPIHEFVIMEKAAKSLANALRAIGMHDGWGEDYKVTFTGGDGDRYDFTIKLSEGKLDFYITEQTRTQEVRVFGGTRQDQRKVWVAYALVMNQGTRDDPPFEDDVEVAEGVAPVDVLLQAILCYFRNTMYDSLPQHFEDKDIEQ